jgi:hypothetical protein
MSCAQQEAGQLPTGSFSKADGLAEAAARLDTVPVQNNTCGFIFERINR